MHSRQPWRDDDIRLLYLRELQWRLGDFLLIGAHARDVLCNDLAGVTRQMPSTTDLDIAVAIPARGARYEDKVSHLDAVGSTSAMRFHLPEDADVPEGTRVPIDVIPYGAGVEDVKNIRLDRERTLDASGIEEAALDALGVHVHSTLAVTVPRLHAMVGLKLLAYGLRSQWHEYKDARDLALLFEAMTDTDCAVEDSFNHAHILPDEAVGDSAKAGPWLAGVRTRAVFGDVLTHRILSCLDKALPARMVRFKGWEGVAAPTTDMVREQLSWFREGARDAACSADIVAWPPDMPKG